MVSRLSELFAKTVHQMGWAFEPAARWLVPGEMKADRAPFDEAWAWCREHCHGKWRYEGAPREGGVLFLFEAEDDGLLFALRF